VNLASKLQRWRRVSVTSTCGIDFFWAIHTLALSATELEQENFGGSSPSSPGVS
jgi:hypothetical protein